MADGAILGTQFIRVMADTASYDAAISTTEGKTVQAGTAMEGAFAKVNPVLASLAGTTSTASASVDKLNASIQVSILKQQLATATREKDTAAMEMYAAALDQVTADTAIASGANEALARSLQQLAAEERIAAAAAAQAAEMQAAAAAETAAAREANMAALDKLGIPTMGAGLTVAAAGAALAIVMVGRSALESANHIEHLSQELGISAESLSKWEYAGKTVDINIDDISRAIGLLAKQMVKGTDETGKTSKGLENLGLSAANSKGQLKSTDEMLGEIAERFKQMPDGPLKTASAMEVFGRSGKQMIPLLNLGRAGLDELREAAERAGYVLSQEAAEKAHLLTVQIEEMKLGMAGMARTAMGDLIPALLVLTADLGHASEAADKFARPENNIVDYFLRWKPLLTATATGIREVAAGIELTARVSNMMSQDALLGPFAFTLNHLKERAKELQTIYAEYSATVARAGQTGVNALEGVPENPNVKQGAEQITAHTDAVDKLNRSLQMNILQQRLKNAEDAGNIPLQEKLSAAIRAVTNYDDIQAGADKNLVAISETMAAAIEHRTLATAAATEAAKKQAEIDKENEKAAVLRLKIESDAEAAQKRLGDAIDAFYVSRDNTERAYETFMVESHKRMAAATLTGQAAEVAAIKDAAEKRKAQIQTDLEERKVTWDQAKDMILQSETETNAELAKNDEKYASNYVSILHHLIAEQSQAKDQMVHYAEQAAGQMTSSMSDVFFDTMTGKFNDLGKVAKNFLSQLLRDITNFLAEQATKKLLELAFNFASTYSGRSTFAAVAGVTSGGDGVGATAINAPSSSSSSITFPPSFSSAMSAPNYPPMPSPSSSRGNGGNHTLDISLDHGLVASLVGAGAEAGYSRVMDDARAGGPMYRIIRRSSGLQ